MRDRLIADRIKGSIIGGGIGDALGYVIEFSTLNEIKKKYGENGIQEFELETDGTAHISDDTQMTMYTANGLILYATHCKTDRINSLIDYVHKAYMEWLITQRRAFRHKSSDNFNCWISYIERLWSTRAPGNTCLGALSTKQLGVERNRLNNSKGCGGVMRVAPVGLYMPQLCEKYTDVMRIGCDVALLTHGHPYGYLTAGILADIIARIVYSKDSYSLEAIIEKVLLDLKEEYSGYTNEIKYLVGLINKAIELAKSDVADTEAIDQLGRGWVAEETLAIAVYCSVKYQGDLKSAVRAAVNHDGDSDSTGAVTGNIVGALVGYSSIDKKWVDKLECNDILLKIADDLCVDIVDWNKRYSLVE